MTDNWCPLYRIVDMPLVTALYPVSLESPTQHNVTYAAGIIDGRGCSRACRSYSTKHHWRRQQNSSSVQNDRTLQSAPVRHTSDTTPLDPVKCRQAT